MASKAKLEHYRRLNGKFLRDAEELLAAGDVVQASEKFWGAAAEIVKAYAAKKGLKTRTHGDLWDIVIALDKAHPELGLHEEFLTAGYLHSNFYEDELRPESVSAAGAVVKRFIRKMEGLL
jgi:hypothetical protein